MNTLVTRWAAPLMLALNLTLAFTPAQAQQRPAPLDGISPKNLIKERKTLEYDNLHEKDLMWEKRIWRQINVDEKQNHIFRNEKRPFMAILLDAVRSGEITAYGTSNDEFRDAYSIAEACNLGRSLDTVEIFNPETFEVSLVPVVNELDLSSVKKYRVKEVFFFDEETGTMGVRILGIAPIVPRYSENGDLLFEGPLFWAYYPELRQALARETVFIEGNDASNMSWEDAFESRMFASVITKESNIHDRRIQDYLTGIDAVIEAEKIAHSIQNFEHDMWEY